MYEHATKNHPQFSPSLILNKYGGVRSDELVYLQRKNICKLQSYWLRYQQKKNIMQDLENVPNGYQRT